MMKQFFAILISAIVLFSCRQQMSSYQVRMISETLQQSNQITANSIEMYRHAMEDKLRDPCTRSIALGWQPRMVAIQAAADSTIAYLNAMKTVLMRLSSPGGEKNNGRIQKIIEENGPNFLFEKLLTCKSNMVSAITDADSNDSPFLKENTIRDSIRFAQSLPLLYGYTDSSLTSDEQRARQWYDSSFSYSNLEMTLMMLEKTRNDLLISEYELLKHCLNQTAVLCCGIRSLFFPLVTQSISNIKTGDAIEVTAGIGFFSIAEEPLVSINGKNVSVGPDGVAQYTVRPKKAPGNYFIPVTISYTRPDGTRESVSKNLSYTISQ